MVCILVARDSVQHFTKSRLNKLSLTDCVILVIRIGTENNSKLLVSTYSEMSELSTCGNPTLCRNNITIIMNKIDVFISVTTTFPSI